MDVAIIIAERIVDGHGRHVYENGLQAGLFDRIVDVVEQIGFHGDDHDFDLGRVAAIDQLVVPHDFVDGVGDVLLRLKPDDLVDLLLADGRQF